MFFASDVRNALLAADEASSSTARVCAAVGGDPVPLRACLEGYRAALSTVALAFGLRRPSSAVRQKPCKWKPGRLMRHCRLISYLPSAFRQKSDDLMIPVI